MGANCVANEVSGNVFFLSVSAKGERRNHCRNETLVVVGISALVKYVANICEQCECLLVYTSLSERVNLF